MYWSKITKGRNEGECELKGVYYDGCEQVLCNSTSGLILRNFYLTTEYY